jgi:hypothetical protein
MSITVLSGSMTMCFTFSTGVGERVRGGVTDLCGDECLDIGCDGGEIDRLRGGVFDSDSGDSG